MTRGQLSLARRRRCQSSLTDPRSRPETEATMNVKDLGNRAVLITGAGSGIGRQLALPCAASIGRGRGVR
jgi:FlaA1/EpsC-like NDP-sugar epimerase